MKTFHPDPSARGNKTADALAERRQADAWAAMMDEILIDIDDLDPVACPPDRRFFLKDKEAWVYEHGNVCELVYVKV